MPQTFPAAAKYINAIRRFPDTVLDPRLRSGVPRGKGGAKVAEGADPLIYSGGFAKVFLVDVGADAYALKCWTMDIGDAASRYKEIDAFLRRIASPHFAEFEFVTQGIIVDGERYPTLRMGWVRADGLREYLRAHLESPEQLRTTAEAFLEMVRTLHQYKISHGDLQSDNIKVRTAGDRVAFQLIDYDTLYVPDSQRTKSSNGGLPSYQHPRRTASAYSSPLDDYFSELVIYLTIHALAEDKSLWHDFGVEHNDKAGLLFRVEDFSASSPSPLFQRLRGLSPFVSAMSLALWNFTRCNTIEVLIPLESAVDICRGSGSGFSALWNSLPQQGAAHSGWLQEWNISSISEIPKAQPTPARPPGAASPLSEPSGNIAGAPTTAQPPPRPAIASVFESLLNQTKIPSPGGATLPPPPKLPPRPNTAPAVRKIAIGWIFVWIIAIIFLLILILGYPNW